MAESDTLLPEDELHIRSRDGFSQRLLRLSDMFFPNFTRLVSWLVVALLIFILAILIIEAWEAIAFNGWGFFFGLRWNPVDDIYGAIPAICGTLFCSFLALLIAVPLSIGTAVFLSEVAPAWLRSIASFIIEMLAAIPSVIIGMWGAMVLVPFVREPIQKWLGENFGWLPFFQGVNYGSGYLSAGLILAMMCTPIITSMSREVLRSVPNSQREAMFALGATRWETISKVVLPYGRSGLVGAVILGLGRALGETMAVTMVIGNLYEVPKSLFSLGTTIPSKIASGFREATGVERASIIELALVLFGITLLVNVVARLLVWRTTRGKAGKE
jgi:phosphate transport system permease protein